MATAREERGLAVLGRGCLGRAKDDEPVFILRGQDVFAPMIVRLWVDLARIGGASQDKLEDAMRTADLMEAWEPKKYPD